jgi:hypothetical protein
MADRAYRQPAEAESDGGAQDQEASAANADGKGADHRHDLVSSGLPFATRDAQGRRVGARRREGRLFERRRTSGEVDVIVIISRTGIRSWRPSGVPETIRDGMVAGNVDRDGARFLIEHGATGSRSASAWGRMHRELRRTSRAAVQALAD